MHFHYLTSPPLEAESLHLLAGEVKIKKLMIKSKVEMNGNDILLLYDLCMIYSKFLKGFMKMSETLFVFGVFMFGIFWEHKYRIYIVHISIIYYIVSSDVWWRSPRGGFLMFFCLRYFCWENMGGFVFPFASVIARTDL